ncbi:methyltransferase [Mycobacteroides sp. H001]|uniref:class I SAM-dependent methyltransferase n=1 Tax=Mycobacteroides TaxID=670516 RepID=UPI000713FAF9|nr:MULTISPECIES: class I SAM-dependent methyltransferase [Mycobacteroides]KRQ23797.1 methyltransferase [Mycobacteroides sp. H072]KRQ36734.1 methyltransferase [Mycobacteroides sp. H002]KRQ55124.1 methyltransferase [Mycobacteroides sp. H054]KRQ72419.1 methyltransferase [Mycobacteroides sp. H001]OHU43272.1 methyltransferase [Mycobacteroides chelonae]
MPTRWNHNIHYQREVLRRVPASATDVLDVGCGTGMLTRELAPLAQRVVGIDSDDPSLRIARTETSAPNVEYIHADFLQHPFPAGSFDLIAAIASLHHMDVERGLQRMSDLLKPGGRIVVVGFAASHSLADLWYNSLGFWTHRYYRFRHGWWEHPSPIICEGLDSHDEVRRIAQRVLPGARLQRLVLWRHLLTWEKPS